MALRDKATTAVPGFIQRVGDQHLEVVLAAPGSTIVAASMALMVASVYQAASQG
jgi:hypothetical protein